MFLFCEDNELFSVIEKGIIFDGRGRM